ncbi:MgtC/SapB family protein [Mesorhizobium sp.]|uniref:MgtC/SapB family protein n=1 Tax=Mesorhizobium sp. TaxID=1871066 RepID=UPI000FE8C657|nr:MgtC/SapB family protein [Mesorhizobium sp.]RWC39186.1 MAG: MgtC/SapB family protein [Mesorhizobium sp.]RWC55129.1 MAG: MgtC/SapB family protein [Mesorhizobium sp.]RWC60192.1 MAG: MgtC/SapB family protein [Mesorhizobium sp.]TIX00016.1 MAG: MgtC/SapB family protein [Mesorhizobium sp.]
MPLNPDWQDIVVRLVLTVVAGAAIGLDRETRGHSAGFRTTILVGLAAALTMVQANILLGVGGKSPDSFGSMDVLRFPLGVLTGVGFIGGGAILRRGNLVSGVTTAATLWVMTAIGLAFGGGQYGLGAAGTGLTLLTLLVLKWIDLHIPRDHHAELDVAWKDGRAGDLDDIVKPLGYRARLVGLERRPDRDSPVFSFEIGWRRPDRSGPPTDLLSLVDRHCEIAKFHLVREPMH